jgi:ubiquinone/menaquinone biosynthesis C-methylase UbiE
MEAGSISPNPNSAFCRANVGAGDGVIGVDIDPGSVAHAREAYCANNLRFLQRSAVDLILHDASADAVVSFEALEQIREHTRFLAEVRLIAGGAVDAEIPSLNDALFVRGQEQSSAKTALSVRDKRCLQTRLRYLHEISSYPLPVASKFASMKNC